MNRILLLSVCFISVLHAQAGGFIDAFADPADKVRLLERGKWTLSEGTASCISDPELYKKYANHGPIVRWSQDFTEGSIEFEMKSSGCQRVVFTLNGDGHVFRVITAGKTDKLPAGVKPATSRIIAWPTKSSKTNKGDALKPKGLPDLDSVSDKWTKVKLEIKGDAGTLAIGDWETALKHPALAREKSSITLSFAFGELAVRNVKVATP